MKASLTLIIGVSFCLFGCSQEKVVDFLQERDGLMYEAYQEEAFTGRLESYWDEEKTYKKAQANYVDGKVEGLELWWHANGQKKFEGTMKGGVTDGLHSMWLEDGRRVVDSLQERDGLMYEDNQQEAFTGRLLIFRDAKIGKPWFEQNYINGKLEGLETWWHENGNKESEANYINGIKEGLSTRWFEHGQKHQEQNYVNGEQEGETAYWYKNGVRWQ